MKSSSRPLLNILFWSVISAAFIGPGTVTTAAKAGASYGYSLLWALTFSTLACIVLQEAAARLPLVSGRNLGQAISENYSFGLAITVFLAIFLGGIAYQAGNILGAISGLALFIDIDSKIFTLIVVIVAGLVLWVGKSQQVAKGLGILVGIMGIAFLLAALSSDINWTSALSGSFVPSLPGESAVLAIGLIGTTIVPYNLFLGSGLSKDQSISEMRLGLGVAILLGGIISMAILLVGAQVEGEFSFQALAQTLAQENGAWASGLFGMGLFAAGLTSSITAPLAAAITAKSIIGTKRTGWSEGETNYRIVWLIILLAGLVFGLLDVKPIPVIILAQALNGLLLPFIAIFLFLIINNPKIIPQANRNSVLLNVLTLIITGISLFLGLTNVAKALGNTLATGFQQSPVSNSILGGISLAVCLGLGIGLWRRRN